MNHSVSVVYLCRHHKQVSTEPTHNLLELTFLSSICLIIVLMSSVHVSQDVSHILTINFNQHCAGIRYFAVRAVFPSHLMLFIFSPQHR